MQMKKVVLVTGAAGFIGRYVARCYHEHGWYVIALGHGSFGENEQHKWGIDEWHYAECDFSGLSAARAERASVIVHCAGSGSVGLSVKYPEVDFARNTGCTASVLGFIRQCATHIKFILLSSAAVYGMVEQLPIQENTVLKPISPYGLHKKMSEELCQLYGRQYGIQSIIVRLFSVYGNGLRKQLLWDACNKMAQSEAVFWGTGKETRDWVHVTDVAELLFIAKNFADVKANAVNCGSGRSVSIETVLKNLASSLGYSENIKFNGQVDVGNPKDYLADIDNVASWGWKPQKELSEGVDDYVRWFNEQR